MRVFPGRVSAWVGEGRFFPAMGLLALLAAAWEAAVRGFAIPPYILPAPSRVARAILQEYPLLWRDAGVTLMEVGLGFLVAAAVGIALAFAIFHSPTLEKTLYPLIVASQTVPVFAIAPLLIVWFGYGLAPKVIMTALIVFFPIVVNTVDGLRAVDEDMVNLLRILRASPWTILWTVRVPGALPFIFSGAKVGVAVSVIGAVIGEWVGSQEGLGYVMIHANAQLRVDLIFAAILYLSVMAVGLFALVSAVEWLALPWRRA
ncbi:MAG: ABC transporter permease [Armatimonadetes bacterium]|nr:ABC transporter permease [Armatimonadota bacterium]